MGATLFWLFLVFDNNGFLWNSLIFILYHSKHSFPFNSIMKHLIKSIKIQQNFQTLPI